MGVSQLVFKVCYPPHAGIEEVRRSEGLFQNGGYPITFQFLSKEWRSREWKGSEVWEGVGGWGGRGGREGEGRGGRKKQGMESEGRERKQWGRRRFKKYIVHL